MSAARTMRNDSPWQRLPWTGLLAMFIWLLAVWAMALFLNKAPNRPERPSPINVQIIELPESPAPSSIVQPQSPQVRRLPKPAVVATPPTAAPVTGQQPVQQEDELQQALTSSSQEIRQDSVVTTPSKPSQSDRHPGTAIRAESAGVVAPPAALSVYNEEATMMDSMGMEIVRGEWMQEFSDDRDLSTEAEGHTTDLSRTFFQQPPNPWCYDANGFNPWEIGTCRDNHDKAIAAYKRQDYATAFARFKKLAVLEYAPAQFSLGTMYADGLGVAKDEQQAVYWWRKAAKDGDAKAPYNLALAYSDGKGVPKDDKQAAYWYTKAAYFGITDAQYNLGLMYAAGTGVAKDNKQSAYWYGKAADRGNAVAQYNLGALYADGVGVPKDGKKAAYWYCKASSRGEAKASFSLALLYAPDAEQPRDSELAYFCWLVFRDKGNNVLAEQERGLLVKHLTPQQRINAEVTSRNWKKK
jgi:hypothetical protein